MSKILSIIKSTVRPIYKHFRYYQESVHIYFQTYKLKSISFDNKSRIFYLGVPSHSNLGDMAQYYCINLWLSQSFPNTCVYEFESRVVIDQRFSFIDKLTKLLTDKDLIVFQSGYTTQDLGGYHDLMHRLIIDNNFEKHILMMPQTIFFRKNENMERTSKSYDSAKNMLFLARDRISFQMAVSMFPNISVELYPDIVTSLIGRYKFSHERKGVLICRRNDGEKFFSEDEIDKLRREINDFEPVNISDTSVNKSHKKIKKRLKAFIEEIIEDYSRYKLVITDRYHGTIFSLAANTPVIVLKTNDHKVITGADWFEVIYEGYIFKSESIADASSLAKNILSKKYGYSLEPYFNKEYYDTKLKGLLKAKIAFEIQN